MLTIAGNKADLEGSRKVDNAEVEKFAKQHNATHVLVSAKNGLGIQELFKDISERIYRANCESKPVIGSSRRNKGLIIETEPKPAQGKKKKECCS